MITKKTLYKIAHLARLNIQPSEEDALLKDMTEILHWVDKLKELDTEGVEPLTHMTEEINVLREDIVEKSLSKELAMQNAPQTDGQYFQVPKVLKSRS